MLSQITTKEDVLFSGITIKQLLLWVSGGLVATTIYLLPPSLHLTLIKASCMILVACFTLLASLKRNNQLLIDIWIMRTYFWLRPKVLTESYDKSL